MHTEKQSMTFQARLLPGSLPSKSGSSVLHQNKGSQLSMQITKKTKEEGVELKRLTLRYVSDTEYTEVKSQ